MAVYFINECSWIKQAKTSRESPIKTARVELDQKPSQKDESEKKVILTNDMKAVLKMSKMYKLKALQELC